MVSPGLKFVLSNSMCSVVPKAIGAQAASRSETMAGTEITSRAGRLINSRAKPSMWKPMMPPTFYSKLSRPSRQAAHFPHAMAPYITTLSPTLNWLTPPPMAAISPGAFGANHQRQFPLGEGHAAIAPDVEMVERDRLDAHLHLAFAGGRRSGYISQFELAVADQLECAHGWVELARPSGRLKPHNQRKISPAEPE